MVKIHMINKSNKFRLMVKGDLNVGVLLLPEGFDLLQRIVFQNK
jgi:hypothetical protein